MPRVTLGESGAGGRGRGQQGGREDISVPATSCKGRARHRLPAGTVPRRSRPAEFIAFARTGVSRTLLGNAAFLAGTSNAGKGDLEVALDRAVGVLGPPEEFLG